MSGYRPKYTLDEEKKIIDYITATGNYDCLREETFWKEMEAKKVIDRAWRSAHQHFRKRLIYKIDDPVYDIPQEKQKKIRGGWFTTASASSGASRSEKKVVDFHNASSSDEND